MNKIKEEINDLFIKYDKLYKYDLVNSTNILEYGENEFFGGKREAFQEILELFEKYKL